MVSQERTGDIRRRHAVRVSFPVLPWRRRSGDSEIRDRVGAHGRIGAFGERPYSARRAKGRSVQSRSRATRALGEDGGGKCRDFAECPRCGSPEHDGPGSWDCNPPSSARTCRNGSNASTSATASGESTVASCVVFDTEGPVKSDYRRFNIEGIARGDDYGAIEQTITRRYSRPGPGRGRYYPTSVVIDGGAGQVNRAAEVLKSLQLGDIALLGIAKGPTRRPGLETIVQAGGGVLTLPPNGPAMHLLQQVRDEAHAIRHRRSPWTTPEAEASFGAGRHSGHWAPTQARVACPFRLRVVDIGCKSRRNLQGSGDKP